MTAPQIPNLLSTLRASKAARGGRAGRNPNDDDRNASDEARDRIVQQTDDDAAGSRLSAVEAGYLDDPFARAFAAPHDLAVRRMPIINRGTYVRTTAIDTLVDAFLAAHAGRRTQIISLGAGTDTRFFRLQRRRRRDALDNNNHDAAAAAATAHCHYHELDFPATTARKIAAIERSPALLALLQPAPATAADRAPPSNGASSPPQPHSTTTTPSPLHISTDKTSLTSPNYTLHALDLRALASPTPPLLPTLAPDIPTLLLSECCLTYLDPATSAAVLRHFAAVLVPDPTTTTTPLHVVLYEPVGPGDAFGRTMLANLKGRGIRMPGLEALPTVEAHWKRLRGVLGEGDAVRVEGWSVRQWWDGRVGSREKERLRRCEMVDEEEEWMLLAGHYAVLHAWRGDAGG